MSNEEEVYYGDEDIDWNFIDWDLDEGWDDDE